MKTEGDIRSDIYAFVKETALADSISGILSKTKRPLNSESEDIVISVLSNTLGQDQIVSVLVNIYVPEQYWEKQYEENTKRTDELKAIAQDIFLGTRPDGYAFLRPSDFVQTTAEVEDAHVTVISNKITYHLNTEET